MELIKMAVAAIILVFSVMSLAGCDASSDSSKPPVSSASGNLSATTVSPASSSSSTTTGSPTGWQIDGNCALDTTFVNGTKEICRFSSFSESCCDEAARKASGNACNNTADKSAIAQMQQAGLANKCP
eukprot:TRINITY_DN9662_c0_g1_i1.p1 TRINITY_DN9662_c0_g1~~TRINITY_DN9662_c0_g1_i1.p1  ORF type:complete len:128 (+),score=27.73 TRINITY_DN9662_c0_g1_i1:59-442(+)